MNKVRMIGPDGRVSIITKAEADAMTRNVFFRTGSVSIQQIENGCVITDAVGVTILTLIKEEEQCYQRKDENK